MPTGGCRDASSQEVAALDASVQAIEQKLRDIQRFINQEKQAVVKARALISACTLQHNQLQYISSHLPAHLPQADSSKSQSTTQLPTENASINAAADSHADADENAEISNVQLQPAVAKQAAAEKKKRPRAPRRYALASSSCDHSNVNCKALFSMRRVGVKCLLILDVQSEACCLQDSTKEQKCRTCSS